MKGMRLSLLGLCAQVLCRTSKVVAVGRDAGARAISEVPRVSPRLANSFVDDLSGGSV